MLPKVQTPYYLAGKQKSAFHRQQATKGAAFAAGSGIALYAAAKHPHHVGAILGGISRSPVIGVAAGHVHTKTVKNLAIAGAAGGVAFAGYHALRAHQYKKVQRDRRVARKGNR